MILSIQRKCMRVTPRRNGKNQLRGDPDWVIRNRYRGRNQLARSAYCSAVVPGFLQTPGYARALLSAIGTFRDTPDDVEEAVAARMSRNRMLRSSNHRFGLLVEESVLWYRLGEADVMAAQLGYLLEATELPSMSLGVIPFTAQRKLLWPLESFTVFDDERVHVELLSFRRRSER